MYIVHVITDDNSLPQLDNTRIYIPYVQCLVL